MSARRREDLYKVSLSELQQINLNFNVHSLTDYNSKYLLIGSEKGLFLINKLSKEISKSELFSPLKNYKITAILNDRNSIWIGTENNGIYKYDLKTQILKNFSKEKKLRYINITSIVSDKKSKTIVFGTLEGIYIYDKIKTSVKTINTDNGLPHNVVKCIFVDSKNKIWFGFKGLGLSVIENNEFTVF